MAEGLRARIASSCRSCATGAGGWHRWHGAPRGIGVDTARRAPNVAHAAQACSTLVSGQVYCLTKTDAVDPLRVGETQLFTITESLTAGALQVVDNNPLTDIVPNNFNVTDV